ncbi:MgtC/SapB family protein [Paenibacillus qinlingensis]|uniref:Mg2+ transporter-C (MgtC) family protein n=1 Tax=Paenibacillus qinlingensis TaxID=1837343 RepID=A0ABU1NNY3_9BACL|nr:MgtC/SapB family protein [Paenibacillus qinlingensis]MDR6549173.1 putative Mg2+ transporter-C (MgtC) family protein [Paenibacillus qinlingensis]
MADISSVWHISHLDLLIRMLAATVLGGLIGLEREWSNHAAGFRTHILVCLGSTTIMLLSIYGFSEFVNESNVRADPARLAAQVISGIGFLGAGAILRNGSVVSGLTTAASVWVVAAVGLCVGAGFYFVAVLCTFLALVSLLLLNKWEKHLLRNRRVHEITVKVIDHPGVLGKIASALGDQGIQIMKMKMMPDIEITGNSLETPTMQLCFTMKAPEKGKLLAALDEIHRSEYVLSADSPWLESSPIKQSIKTVSM